MCEESIANKRCIPVHRTGKEQMFAVEVFEATIFCRPRSMLTPQSCIREMFAQKSGAERWAGAVVCICMHDVVACSGSRGDHKHRPCQRCTTVQWRFLRKQKLRDAATIFACQTRGHHHASCCIAQASCNDQHLQGCENVMRALMKKSNATGKASMHTVVAQPLRVS